MNFIKIYPETALKYFFEKMWLYMKYIVKKSRVENTYVHVRMLPAVISNSQRFTESQV